MPMLLLVSEAIDAAIGCWVVVLFLFDKLFGVFGDTVGGFDRHELLCFEVGHWNFPLWMLDPWCARAFRLHLPSAGHCGHGTQSCGAWIGF